MHLLPRALIGLKAPVINDMIALRHIPRHVPSVSSIHESLSDSVLQIKKEHFLLALGF